MDILVNDKFKLPCLIDSGSQISAISETCYNEMLNCQPSVIDTTKWLKLTAANGLDIPYLGYIELNIVFAGISLNEMGFLVFKDAHYKDKQGLIGCNILNSIAQLSKETSIDDN